MQLHKLVEEALPELDTMIGWAQGYDPLHATPTFIRDAKSISRLIWSPFCSQNLTGYLVKPPALQPVNKEKQIGICVKGCDSRSLVALIQEKFLTRDRLRIFGIPCRGTVDWRKVMRQVDLSHVRSARAEDNLLTIDDARGTHKLNLEEVLARKCLRCRYPNPVVYDVLVGEPAEFRIGPEDGYRDVDTLEKRPLEDRLAFWQSESTVVCAAMPAATRVLSAFARIGASRKLEIQSGSHSEWEYRKNSCFILFMPCIWPADALSAVNANASAPWESP